MNARYNLVGGKPRYWFEMEMNYEQLLEAVEHAIPTSVEELERMLLKVSNVDPLAVSLYREDEGRSVVRTASMAVDAIILKQFGALESKDAIAKSLKSSESVEKHLLYGLTTRKILLRPLAIEFLVQYIGPQAGSNPDPSFS